MTTADVLRLWAISLLALSLILWLLWFWRSPTRLYAVPILLWIVNALAFTATRQTNLLNLSPAFLNNWSLAVYIQAGLTLVGIGAYAVWRKVEPRAGC
jgi:hypothetical protein